MINQFMLVGRISRIEQGKVMVVLPRYYKNNEGSYDTDFVSVTIKGEINEKAREHCRKGDMIGIKGHISCLDNNLELIAEKVSFLSSSKGSAENENE